MFRQPIGIYLHFGRSGNASNAYTCIVEVIGEETLVVRDPDDASAMRIVLSHLNYSELECLIQTLYVHRKIA